MFLTLALIAGIAVLCGLLYPWGPRHANAPPRIPLRALGSLTKSNTAFRWEAEEWESGRERERERENKRWKRRRERGRFVMRERDE